MELPSHGKVSFNIDIFNIYFYLISNLFILRKEQFSKDLLLDYFLQGKPVSLALN